MIVVDTSAVITTLLQEPGHEDIFRRLLASSERAMPATVIVEATMVLSRFHRDPKAILENYRTSTSIDVIPVDAAIAAAAQDAFLKFGKGRHPARLNLCDCFSYASARTLGCPLLFIGNDFAQTDIAAA
ncbi:MAG: type II toxin-antitoxin system VapC family toxin [Proteobacteria bacterium]|nr:type II toxin-antitoxin system VapC family toxin [Pseudomonadota bacterium]